MLVFIAFLIFAGFPIFEFPLPLANAITVLTTGHEAINANFSHSDHHFYWNRIRIPDFDRDAQCYAEPGADIIGSYSLVLQLGGDAMLGNEGLTICYVGQLDPSFTIHGLTASMPYRISNRLGHPLAGICEEGKEKLKQGNDCRDPECYEFVIREWHAIQFLDDPNGRDLQMIMSTSNHTFRIPRDQLLENGLLVFKFTTANGYKAKFSKTIGPGKQVGRRPTIREKKSEVKVEIDENLELEYFKHVHAGARLEQFNAPYAISVDFLPLMEGIKDFSVFLIRSECSQVPTMFLTPTDTNPTLPKPIQMKSINVNKSEPIGVLLHSTTLFRGRVHPKAESFTFQYSFKHVEDNINNKLTLQMVVEFKKENQMSNDTKFEVSKNDGPFNLLNKSKELKFIKGANFLFKVLSDTNYLLVSLNCGPYIAIDRGAPLTDKLRIKIEASGDVDVFKVWNDKMHKGNRYHAINFVNLNESGMGYFIRAKPFENWNEIKIELKTANEAPVLRFFADNNKIELYHGNKTHLMEDKYIESRFELQFNWFVGQMEVLYNDESPWQFPMDNTAVGIVQINADFKLDKNATIHLMPWIFPIEIAFNNGKEGVQIEGKVLPTAEVFSIRWYFGTGKEVEQCYNEDYMGCEIVLVLEANFTTGKTLIGNFLRISEDKNKKIWRNQTLEHNRFVKGRDFQLSILPMKNGKYSFIYGHANGQYDEFEGKLVGARRVHVTGDIFIFEKPQIISMN